MSVVAILTGEQGSHRVGLVMATSPPGPTPNDPSEALTVQQGSTGQSGKPPVAKAKASGDDGAKAGEGGQAEGLKIIGGLLALAAGLIALIIVVVIALIVKPDTTGGSIATSAIGVVGSIVGAYFGVKIGTDGTKDAIKANEGIAEAHQEEAIKAQVYALHTPSEKAAEVVEHIKALSGPNAKVQGTLLQDDPSAAGKPSVGH